MYACSSHEISSSDSLVPHLPFISAPRDSGMSACSVISYERGAGLSGASPAGRPTTRSAALQPARPPHSPAGVGKAPPSSPPGPTHIHVVAGPHVVRDEELGGEFRHQARRPVFPHDENVLFGVRGEPGQVFNFLLGSQASRGVCGQRGAERRQHPSAPPSPAPGLRPPVATGRPMS